LVNNAGILRDKSFHKVTLEDFELVMDVHFQGTLNCTHSVFPIMREQEYGRIIFTSSSSGVFGNFGQTNYSATKAGVQSMAVVWAKELSKYGIRVNSIAPGFINTEMVAGMPDNVKEKLSKMVPVGRIGEPDEVAQAAEFIFMNDYYSGRCVDLDGAQRM